MNKIKQKIIQRKSVHIKTGRKQACIFRGSARDKQQTARSTVKECKFIPDRSVHGKGVQVYPRPLGPR